MCKLDVGLPLLLLNITIIMCYCLTHLHYHYTHVYTVICSCVRNRVIATITTMVCLDFFVVSLVFDGLNMSGDNYSADPFLYLVLSGLVEAPGYSLTAPLIDRFGRRIPTSLGYLLCGVVIFALAFIPPGEFIGLLQPMVI